MYRVPYSNFRCISVRLVPSGPRSLPWAWLELQVCEKRGNGTDRYLKTKPLAAGSRSRFDFHLRLRCILFRSWTSGSSSVLCKNKQQRLQNTIVFARNFLAGYVYFRTTGTPRNSVRCTKPSHPFQLVELWTEWSIVTAPRGGHGLKWLPLLHLGMVVVF